MSFTTIPQADARARVAQRGFTLLELVLSVAIVAVTATVAMSSYQAYRGRVQAAQAVTDITALQGAIGSFALDNHRLPATLDELGPGYDNVRDPWGSKYQYRNHVGATGTGQLRQDKRAAPLNSDFDLYSAGPDRDSQPALAASVSRDDVVRASNGRFVGIASTYDP